MQEENSVTKEDQIELKDILNFVRTNSRFISIMAIAGLMLAVAYISMATKKYEVHQFLQMARYLRADSGLAVIETPVALAERLRYSAAYTEAAKRACGIAGADVTGDYLGGKLKISTPKAQPNVLEMRILATTPDLARQCAEAVVLMIGQQQNALIEDSLLGKAEQLASFQRSLSDEMKELQAINNASTGGIGYLAKLDKLSWLRTRISQVQEELMLAQKHPAQLLMPAQTSETPVTPKIKLSLFIGVLLGLTLGVLIPLAKIVWRKASA